MIRVFFFGALTGSGAGLFLRDAQYRMPASRELPASLRRIDAVFTCERPRSREEVCGRSSEPEHEGRGFIHYIDGWTVIAWWDRSEDKRYGCNAAFLVEGRHRFAAALDLARESFPREMTRMEAAYPVTLAGPDLPEDLEADAACAFVAAYNALHPTVRDAVRAMIAGSSR